MKFAKYEGAGNDFILFDTRGNSLVPQSKMIARLCDRHFGIGADGIMTLDRSEQYDCSMRYYNADGSAGEMCGNGGRCFTLFAHHLGIGGPILRFDSLDGPHTACILTSDRFSGRVALGMIDVKQIAAGDGWWFLNTGVPHYVEFTNNIDGIDVSERGRTIRNDRLRFPEGTNVNFVQVEADGRLRMRTYERGVEAETLACGTGVTAAALVTNFALQPSVHHFGIAVPGGILEVEFERESNTSVYHNIRLTGEARKVFDGTIDTDNL